MKKTYLIIVLFLAIAMIPGIGFAQYTHAEMKEDALYNLDIAKELTSRGQELLRTQPTLDNMKIAAYLYQEAGKLYEVSIRMFEKIGDKNYSRVCTESMNVCIDTIKQINQKAQEVGVRRRRRR